jgi:uncharacterized protein YggE
MRQWTIAIILVALALPIGALASRTQSAPEPANPKKDKRTITTSGTATIKVKPDSARVFFGVQTIAKTVKAAREENSVKVKQVMDALAAMKIPDLKTKTSDVHIELIQSRQREDVLPTILGYRITNTFTVLVKNDNAEKLSAVAGKVMDQALESGANQVQQIVFFKENDQEVKREALAKAVEDAAANAKALASGGKVAILDTITIDGQPQYNYPNYPMQQVSASNTLFVGGTDTALVAGDLNVTCTVTVTCAY